MSQIAISRRGLVAGAACVLAAPRLSLAAPAPRRIVAIGAPITEIMYGLGCGERIVAVDQASRFPRDARRKAHAGYHDDLSIDQLLAHSPDLLVTGEGAGPSHVIDALGRASVKVVTLKGVRRREDIVERIRLAGDAVGEPERGAALAQSVADDLASLAKDLAAVTAQRRTLMVMGLGGGHPLIVGGAGTAAALALELAGGVNAAEHVAGFRALKNERVAELEPEAIIALSMGAPLLAASVSTHPALKDSPANRESRIALADALAFTGFGPRVAHVVAAAARSIYPDADIRPLPPRGWVEDNVVSL